MCLQLFIFFFLLNMWTFNFSLLHNKSWFRAKMRCGWRTDRKWCHTTVAVMKKFQGSSVPKPSMKKMSQTPKYLQEACFQSKSKILNCLNFLLWSWQEQEVSRGLFSQSQIIIWSFDYVHTNYNLKTRVSKS